MHPCPTGEELRASGYFLLPLPPKVKAAPPTGWADRVEPYDIPPGGNVAIRTQGELVILITNDECATAWAREAFGEPNVRTRRGGHWYFRSLAGMVNEANAETAVGMMELHVGRNVEGKVAAKYALIPPSIHPSGEPYTWGRPLAPVSDLPLIPDLRELWHPGGTHHAQFLRMSAAKAHEGADAEAIYRELVSWRDAHLTDPHAHPERELRQLAESAVAKFHPEHLPASNVVHSQEPLCPVASTTSPRGPNYSHLWAFVRDDPKDPESEGKYVPLRGEFENTLLRESQFLAFRDSRELRMYVPARGFYVSDAETYVAAWVRARYAEKKSESGQDLTASLHFVAEVVSTIRDRSYRDRVDVNPPWALVLRNGIFDLRSSALTPHAAEPPHTWALPVGWDPGATAPEFEAFLCRSLPDDAVRAAALEAAGYALWPVASLRLAFFLFGPTTTGKSTFLDVVRGELGPENTTSVDLAELVDNRFRAAELYGRLANIRSDLPAKIVRNIGLFQELTGGRDSITAEKKHQHPFQFRPTAKLFFSANRLPRIPGATPAFWRRWVLLPFEVKVDTERPDYSATLLERERDGIFRLFAEASRRLFERGRFLDLPVEVRDRWMRNSDVALYVCQNEVEDAIEGSISLKDLEARVGEVCEDEGIDEAPDPRELGLAMRRAHPSARGERTGPRGGRQVVYRGVSWVVGRRNPVTAVARGFSDERSLPGATGVSVSIAVTRTRAHTEAVVDPPSVPGIDSLPESGGATAVTGSLREAVSGAPESLEGPSGTVEAAREVVAECSKVADSWGELPFLAGAERRGVSPQRALAALAQLVASGLVIREGQGSFRSAVALFALEDEPGACDIFSDGRAVRRRDGVVVHRFPVVAGEVAT